MNHHSSRRNFWHGRSHNSELTTEGTKYTGTARRVINAAQMKLTITFPNKRIKSDSIPVSVMTVASSQNLYLDWPNTTFLSRCWQFLLTTNLIWKKGKFFGYKHGSMLNSPLLSVKKGLICFLVSFQNVWKGERGSKVRPPNQVHE